MTAEGALSPLVEAAAGSGRLDGALSRPGAVVAVPDPARAFVLAVDATGGSDGPLLVAVPTTGEAERLVHDLEVFLSPEKVELFGAWETLPFERVSPSLDTMGHRLRVLHRLQRRDPDLCVIVSPIRALLQRLGPDLDQIGSVEVGVGDELDQAGLVAELVGLGYRRDYQVERRGDLAVRGSIVDVWPSTDDSPVRIDLWGDEVDRLSRFNAADQRAGERVERIRVEPCRELVPTESVRQRASELIGRAPWAREQWERLADGQIFDGMESLLPWLTDDVTLLTDLLGPEARVVLVEPKRLRDRAADLLAEEADLEKALSETWGVGEEGLRPLHVDFDRLLDTDGPTVVSMTSVPDRADGPAIDSTGWESVIGGPDRLVSQLSKLLAAGSTVVVGAEGHGSAERIAESLAREGLKSEVVAGGEELARPGLWVTVAPLERGFVLEAASLGVLTESDLTGRRRRHRRARPRRQGAATGFEDLAAGDFVVHHTHGVARFSGMVTRAIMGAEKDYLQLEFRGGDRIYLPSDQIDLIRPYSGSDAPKLSKMGGSEWAKSKAKVRSAVREIAQELVVLYQRRLATPGHAFAPDTPWQHEIEEGFGYSETPDQLKAIAEVKADMEAPSPMDRLICGDVGFGKTEVAIRAVFKAVQDGHQAAILVPTTLLAQQHHQTFSDRFADYPIRVEVLSRFLTATQQKRVVADLASGEVDVVIGTHRLLGSDVVFKRLGLLVIDEEQRFGVSHKEAIKQMRTDVDVLTLSATPIPRTLEMSLTGIRDLTLLQTPPAERQPILTYVGEYDERPVAEAIRRELLREGQVFFVHNRVADIDEVANELRELIPEARIAVAHGQMDEGSLEQVVFDFWDREYDVLVCTTIIESGIDMPTVNTLVVDRADLLGLGQLHQLRGRVGRAGQRAYAYLFHPRDQVLSEEAHERLKTIGEATELGSGFRIAMRDLEIRGAGNLLSEDQSGHIAAVGYDLYCQMVTEAVAEPEGGTDTRTGGSEAGPGRGCVPAGGLRGPRGSEVGGVPEACGGPHERRRGRHRLGVARSVRAGARAGPGAAPRG